MIKANLDCIIIIALMIPFFVGGFIIWIKVLKRWRVFKEPPKPPSVFATPMIYWSEYFKTRLGATKRVTYWTSVNLKITFGYFWALVLVMGLWFILVSIFLTGFMVKVILARDARGKTEQQAEVVTSVETESEDDETLLTLETEN